MFSGRGVHNLFGFLPGFVPGSSQNSQQKHAQTTLSGFISISSINYVRMCEKILSYNVWYIARKQEARRT